jgi:hypothetical protein
MRIIFSNYFFIIKITLLLCFLVQISYESIAQIPPGCAKVWLKNGGPSQLVVTQQSPEAVVYAAGGGIDLKLQVFLQDYDQFGFSSGLCSLTTPVVPYLSMLESSMYEFEFSIPNTNDASFNKTQAKVKEVVGSSSIADINTGSLLIGTPPNVVYRYGSVVSHVNKEVILSIKNDWITNVIPPAIPPDIIVTVNVKDVTPGLPAGDGGMGPNTADVSTVTKTFTIKYRNLCPTGLDLVNISQDNIWLSYLIPHQSCLSSIQSDDYAPYCYKGLPDLLADNMSDYTATVINEELSDRIALFQMSDIQPLYLTTNYPMLTDPNALAQIIFPESCIPPTDPILSMFVQ